MLEGKSQYKDFRLEMNDSLEAAKHSLVQKSRIDPLTIDLP